MKRMPAGMLVAATLAVVTAQPVAAQFTTGFDEAAAPCLFDSGVELTDAYATSGVNFSGGYILDACGHFTTPTAFSGSNFLALNSAYTPTVQSIFFDNPWGAFSIWVGSTDAATFQFFLNGSEQFNSGSVAFIPSVWDFYTHTGSSFDEVRITIDDPDGVMTLDDLAVRDPGSTVPEPASMTLLATGLAGLAASRRRRNKA